MTVAYYESLPLQGFIAYFTRQCGGNVHDKGITTVKACLKNALDQSNMKNVVDQANHSKWYSNRTRNPCLSYNIRDTKLTVFLADRHHPVTRGLVEYTGTNAGASQTVRGITKLCRKSGVNISRFGVFPVEKANDYLLLELHENWLNENVHGDYWEMPSYSSTGREGKFDRQALELTLASSLNGIYHFL
jgi:hypothetical protein